MAFMKLDFSRFSLPTALHSWFLTNVPSYRHPARIFTALLSLPSTFCLFDNEKKKSQNTSGRGLNCTSLSLRRDRDRLRMSLGLWFWPLMRTRTPREQWLDWGVTARRHLSPGRWYSPSQGSTERASLELKTDRDVAQADQAEKVQRHSQMALKQRSSCSGMCVFLCP